jgi:hypothetical protein
MTKYPAKYHPRARGNTVSLLVFKAAEYVSPARAWEAAHVLRHEAKAPSITRARMGSRFKCDETSHYKKYLTELNV